MKLFGRDPRDFWLKRPSSPQEWIILGTMLPFSWLYGIAVRCRALGFRWGVLRTWRPPVPVVSVGNLTVGGTGKTPVVDWLAAFLLERGQKVAIVSRGHGGRRRKQVEIVCLGNGPLCEPSTSGDEPFLLARRNPGALVLTSVKRRRAIESAIAEFGAGFILMDDGFQHMQVARDLDILLVDSRRPFGNGRLLPAGPLREPPQGRCRADLLLLTHSEAGCRNSFGEHPAGSEVLTCNHRLSAVAADLDGKKVPAGRLKGEKCIAFAGIGDPGSFFLLLEKAGFQLGATIALPDHAVYDEQVIENLSRMKSRGAYYVTTEKDAVKLSTGFLPKPCYQVPLEIDIHQENRLEKLLLSLLLPHGGFMKISREMLEILACPQCKGPVAEDPGRGGLSCSRCRLTYPVRDDIPVMLIDEAEPF